MTKKDKLLQQLHQHTFAILKPSPLHGIGVFAISAIQKGERKIFSDHESEWIEISKEEVDAILRDDLQRFERGVHTYCPVPLTQGMFDGLVSFAFNVGLGTLQRSTLRQKLLRGDKEGAAEELLKYCMAGGKVLKGLQKRRIDERALFLS